MNSSIVRRTPKPLSTITKLFILFIPVILVFAFAAFFTNIFITLIICMLIAFVLNPLVDYLESSGINRSIAIILIFAVIAFIISFVFRLAIPNITEQWKSLSESFREFNVNEKLKSIEQWLAQNVPFLNRISICLLQ